MIEIMKINSTCDIPSDLFDLLKMSKVHKIYIFYLFLISIFIFLENSENKVGGGNSFSESNVKRINFRIF